MIENLTLQQRVTIAQEFLVEKKIVANIDSTLEHFLAEQKFIFDNAHLMFKNDNKTDDLKSYVKKIKNNLSDFEKFKI